MSALPRPKSNKQHRHQAAVEHYRSFQNIQAKQAMLDNLASKAPKQILPRPGELLVYSNSVKDLGSREVRLADLKDTIMPIGSRDAFRLSNDSRPMFSRESKRSTMSRDSLRISKVVDLSAESDLDFFPSEPEPLLTSQLKTITKSTLSLAPASTLAYDSSRPTTALLSKTLNTSDSFVSRESGTTRLPEYIVRRPRNKLVQALNKSNSSMLRPLIYRPQSQAKLSEALPSIKTDKMNTKFLSLELYDNEVEQHSPRTMLKVIAAASKDNIIKAYSKWFLNDGKFEWRQCEVRRYDQDEERFEIVWPSGVVKLVSRINLRFLHESEAHFEKRIEAATESRNQAELLMKYTFLIESIDSPTTPMPRFVLEQIWHKLQGNMGEIKPYRNPLDYFALDPGDQYDCSRFLWKQQRSHFIDETDYYRQLGLKNLADYKKVFYYTMQDLKVSVGETHYMIDPQRILKLFAEVEASFVFAQHQIEFELDMPYNVQKQELFRPVLPAIKFVSVFDRVKPTNRNGVVEGKSMHFLKILQSIDLHQRWLGHLKILVRQRSQLLDFEQSHLFSVMYGRSMDLEKLVRQHKMEVLNCVRELRNVMFDSQYEVQDIVNVANTARNERNQAKLQAKAYEHQSIDLETSIDATLAARLKRLLVLLNHSIELAARDCLNRSLENLSKQIEDILDLTKLAIKREAIGSEYLSADELEVMIHYEPLTMRSRTRPSVLAELMMIDGKFMMMPSPEEFTEQIEELVEFTLSELKVIPSLEVTDIGFARENSTLLVLEPVAERTETQTSKLKKILEEAAIIPLSFIEALDPFKFLINMRPNRLKKTLAKDFDPKHVGEELQALEEAKAGLEKMINRDDYMMIGVYKVNVSVCKKTLVDRINDAKAKLIELMHSKAKESIELVEQQEQDVIAVLGHEPKHLEELDEMRTFMYTSLEERLSFVNSQVKSVFKILQTFETLNVKAPEEILKRAWRNYGMPKRAFRVRYSCEQIIKKSSLAFGDELRRGTNIMLDEIENLWIEMTKLRTEDSIENYEDVSMSYGVMKGRLETASKESKLINSRELLVGIRPTDFKRLEALRREFTPYCKLWFFVRDFNYHLPRWMRGPMHDLDREAITEEVTTYLTEVNAMERGHLKNNPAGLKVAAALKEEVSKFKPYLPLIYALRNPGLKERHWEELREKTKINLTKTLPLPLEDLLSEGIASFQEFIEEVSDKASRQLALEQAKLKMEHEWDDMVFTLVSYKNTGMWVLADNEPVWELLNDHLLKTFSMCNSPYVKFMEREVTYWKNSLVKTQEILEEWELLQKSWQYLNPILTQDDIIKQLPTATSRFKLVNELWLALMTATHGHPQVLEACLNYPKLLEQLRYANESLESIKKSLDDFLNSKREAFPRFYFLANEELLAILSKSTELQLVQKYIFKCFEGVSMLLLDYPRITGLQSFEGETVHFSKPIDFFQTDSDLPRNIEDWLKEVEKSMYLTMRELLDACYQDSHATPRLEWLLKWPSQLVHSINLAIWTGKATHAIPEGELQHLWNADQKLLNELVDVVRQESRPLARKTLGTSVILDVHKQDVLASLIQVKVKKVTDFEWQAQMRYYISPQNMSVQMIDSIRDYGFEYLGNQDRLVITPLTDRCYRTLMGALKLNLGGAPEGPAGTGKTETTKDLAKSLAKKCVVFNCSDQLDQSSMAKFFTGLASSGAWVCFDEFNRIELEVLSVIAEQISTIQAAVYRRSRKFQFESNEIPLDFSCAIFITMNPDYVGRSALPDNLKSLFRPVAMMIPDYSMIAEISLYSYGFKEARSLAVKLINSLRLASEQLSTQKHYDYGMRTVTTIVKAAGQLKRMNLDTDETCLVLRAINDCNIPKFIASDIELFKGITSDLFPDVQLPAEQSDELCEAIKATAKSMHLVPKPEFLTKVLQVHDTIQVRHGLMLVGSAMAGKTTILDVLAKAITSLHASSPRLMNSYINSERFFGSKVLKRVVNPKSMTLKQLYGDSDPISKDWLDGVLSFCIREFAEESMECPKWIVMDGPVDAVWIENLNTVLDDNKKLCLPSGEIIKLTSSMTMLFEVDDLSAASPATVSRCGMVYVNRAEVVDWNVILELWLSNLPMEYMPHQAYLRTVCSVMVEPCLKAVEECTSVQIKTSAPWLTRCFVNLLESLMLRSKTRLEADQDFKIHLEKEEQRKAKEAAKAAFSLRFEGERPIQLTEQTAPERDVKKDLFCWTFFAATWALGGVLPESGKHAFEAVLRQAAMSRIERTCIAEKVAFELMYNWDTQEWVDWEVEEIQASSFTDISRLLVPTVDTVRYRYLLQLLLPKGNNTIFVGPTGTGKTAISKRFIGELSTSKFLSVSTSLSARASCNQTQDLIESKLIKRMKGVYAPESGKHCIVFVDDLSMPTKEEYGAQPSLEVVRQTVGRKELYERKTCDLRKIEDMTFLAAMTTRQPVSERLLRHFNLICISEFSQEIMKHIFTAILTHGYSDHSQTVFDSVPLLTKITLSVFKEIVDLFPPTPMKSHYSFNLRDLSSVFRGLISVPIHRIKSIDVLHRLWMHECLRVFSDRLTTDEDRDLLELKLEEHMAHYFHLKKRDLLGDKPLLFCNFMEERAYQEVENYEALKISLESSLYEYNARNAHRMNLVLFDFAVQHICRITRIINSVYGNALLIGLGGSGRQSLSLLSAFLLDFKVFQVAMTKTYGLADWQEDLRGLLRGAGLDDKKTVLLLKDSDIRSEVFLENVNNILNSGEVPSLFNKDDKDVITDTFSRHRGLSFKSPAEKWDMFVEACRKNLHVILCMSPIGEKLRIRIRQFPSLVSCCTIDWFTQWPREALESVARRFLNDNAILEADKTETAVGICVHFHETVGECAKRYLFEMRRSYYVTPTHYLQLLQNIKVMRTFKQETSVRLRDKYQRGVNKLNDTQVYVANLRAEQMALEPVLVRKTKETEEIMKIIIKETAEADHTRSIVATEQQESAVQAEVAEKIKNECKTALDTAEPQLKAAKSALTKLKKSELNIVKTMQKPPYAVKLVLEAVAIINRQAPIRVQDTEDRSQIKLDYFEAGKKMMNNPNFKKKLLKFDTDTLDRPLIERIRTYIEDEKFQPHVVKTAAGAAEGLCKWVIAIYNYYFVKEDIGPKQAALSKATAELAAKSELLKRKQEELEVIEKTIAEKKVLYDQANTEKQQLTEDIHLCQVKLERAERLTDKLGGERVRWQGRVESLSTDMKNLIGDVMLAAASASYFGPFISQYREFLSEDWLRFVSEISHIDCNPEFSLKNCLSDSLQVQEWTIQGLPTDKVSIENAIILSHSDRWPLIIDPQKQASKWLKRMLLSQQVQITAIKASTEDLLSILENALFMGSTLMIENVGEELDPILEPILLKQIVVKEGLKLVKIGDTWKQYDDRFKLFLFTNLSNPHYTPETTTKVTLLNFTCTKEGLTEQLLSIVCGKEMTKETEERRRLTVQSAEYVKRMRAFEDSILQMMEKAGTEMLESDTMINSLTESKQMSEEAERRLINAQKTEAIISNSQKIYEPVARQAALLYFAVTDLAGVQQMYQFSLDWFNKLFKRSIEIGEFSKELELRLTEISDNFLRLLFKNINMSLFEKDKLLFAFIVAQRISVSRLPPEQHDLQDIYRKFLLTGRGAGTEEIRTPRANPLPDIFETKQWLEICELSSLQGFEALRGHCVENAEVWQKYCNSHLDFNTDPEYNVLTSYLPAPFNDPKAFDPIQRLLVIRALKPEDLIPAIQSLIRQILGDNYTSHHVTDFKQALQETDCFQPIVFILSSGNDPQLALKKFGEEMKKSLYPVSLGKGQGDRAARMVRDTAQAGSWVLLQNCHLAKSWLPSLEALVEKLKFENEKGLFRVHPEFRLWLTSMPSPYFPVALLQDSFKVTTEPAKGLKKSMNEIYTVLKNAKEDFTLYNRSDKPLEWRKLFFSLAFFHCLVRERRKFGPLGWNIAYGFNDSDFKISMRQLHIMLENNEKAPFKALTYLFGECNYGGRVTDDWDRRTLVATLKTCFNESAIYDHYRFCKLPHYYAPRDSNDIHQYLEFIDKLPNEDSPEVFGLHENANINYARKEVYELFEKLIAVNPMGSSRNTLDAKKDELVVLIKEITHSVPRSFDMDRIEEAFPVTYENSLNVVLQQEAQRYNNLIAIVRSYLVLLNNAMAGAAPLTPELEIFAENLLLNRLPKVWASVSYPSCKPLLSWVIDLAARVNFIQRWIDEGSPKVFWLSGFYFTQSFLTGIRQNYARKHHLPIDQLILKFTVLDSEPDAPPTEGSYVSGLYLQGARWNADTKYLDEPLPKELFSSLPILWIEPSENLVESARSNTGAIGQYHCPVYKTSARAGTLSTTGHSTNYVLTVTLPTMQEERHWVLRGVALLTQLDDCVSLVKN